MTNKSTATNLLHSDIDPHGFQISITKRTAAGVPTEFTATCACGSWTMTGRGDSAEWDRLQAAHVEHKTAE